MKGYENNKKYKRLEEALSESFRADIDMDKTYKKNLDKLVENTIKAKELEQREQVLDKSANMKNRSFLSIFFNGAKWQATFLASFLGMLLLGGVAFAAVPQLREIVIPTKGSLYINSEPEGALVELRGGEYGTFTSIGQTPLNTKFKAGNYEMKVILENYEEYATTFELEAGKTKSFEVKLKKEMSALDMIKEWKTYTDLERGFEFTYPLKWKFEEVITGEADDLLTQTIKVYGENSELIIYFDTHELENSSYEFTISDSKYFGLEDEQGWKYIIFAEFVSEDTTNLMKIAFYTNKEEDVEIYDFIKSTVKIFDIHEENGNVALWPTFTQEAFGFSFKYPNENWIVVEKEKSEYSAVYEVKPLNMEIEPLEVIYSLGYFKDLNEFEVDSLVFINGLKVQKYFSPTCDGKSLYEFPNRFYIVYQSTSDMKINEYFEKIVKNFTIFNNNQFEEISNYDFGLNVTIPETWSYGIAPEYLDFRDVPIIDISSDGNNIYIMRWGDVEGMWDKYVEYLDLDNSTVLVDDIKIDGREYTRWEVWRTESPDSDYAYLDQLLYLPKDISEGSIDNPKMIIGENEFVVVVDLSVETPKVTEFGMDQETLDESISQEDELNSKIIDAIVASLTAIE